MIKTLVVCLVGTTAVFAGIKDSLRTVFLKNDTTEMRVVYTRMEKNTGAGFGKGGRFHTQSILLGYSTKTDSEHVISGTDTTCFLRPLITWDGKRIVYSNATDTTVNIINWDGSGKRVIAKGTGGALWRDTIHPFTEYAIYGKDAVAEDKQPIYRVAIDDTSKRQLIYTPAGKYYSESIFISANGSFIGGNFGWPTIVYYNISTNAAVGAGSGCYPTAPYDNSKQLIYFNSGHSGFIISPTEQEIIIDPDSELEGGYTMEKIGSYSTDIYCVVFSTGSSNSPGGQVFICKIDTAGQGSVKKVLVSDSYSNGWPDARIVPIDHMSSTKKTQNKTDSYTNGISFTNKSITLALPGVVSIKSMTLTSLNGRTISIPFQQRDLSVTGNIEKIRIAGIYIVILETSSGYISRKIHITK